MKILVIEDNRGLVRSLRQALSVWYVVDVAYTGEMGITLAQDNDYDLVLLDLSLPDIEGLEVCKQLRLAHDSLPVLVVTGTTDVESKVELLDAGADDYITKPFNLEELQARIRALLRRQKERKPIRKILQVGDLVMNTELHQVKRGETIVDLRTKEYIILEHLMINAGHVVTRPALINAAWDHHEENWTNTVEVHISRLREKIDRQFGTDMLLTVHGLGYKLVPDPLKTP